MPTITEPTTPTRATTAPPPTAPPTTAPTDGSLDAKLAEARRFLERRGIHGPKPLYVPRRPTARAAAATPAELPPLHRWLGAGDVPG
jgi:hypothetical protein